MNISKNLITNIIVFIFIFTVMFVIVFIALANSEGSDLKGFAKFLNENFSWMTFPAYLVKYIPTGNSNGFMFLLMFLLPTIFWFFVYKIFEKIIKL
jgi:Fe2+ transport system protein B